MNTAINIQPFFSYNQPTYELALLPVGADEAHFTVTNAKRNRGSVNLNDKKQIKIKWVSREPIHVHFSPKSATKTHTLVAQPKPVDKKKRTQCARFYC